jgi:hypothetical protein
MDTTKIQGGGDHIENDNTFQKQDSWVGMVAMVENT